MAFTLKHKLIISSIVMFSMTAGIGVLSYWMVDSLRREQDDGAGAFSISNEAIEVSGIGSKLYQVVADAVINRNLEETDKDWAENKAAALKAIASLDSHVTAPNDKKLIADASASLTVFINLFEHGTLPELHKIDSLAITPVLREIDDKMDTVIAATTKSLESVAASQVAIAKQGDEDFDVTSRRGVTVMLIVLGISSVLALGNAIYLIMQISRPVNSMTGTMKQLAGGDTKSEIPGLKRKDEIGSMAAAVQVFKENMIEGDRLREQQKEAEKRAEVEKRAMMHKLANDFESGIQGIISMVASASTELYHTAEGMQKTVGNVSMESNNAATASQQTSGNVQSVASAVEEMSASVREIASQVAKSSATVNEAVTKTAHADEIVRTLMEAVTQIGSISEMIQNIAGQINLLALNATIESARAGDAGKGFAVVASEVKNLATQTAKATDEIAKQIENVRNVSGEVANSLKEIQSAVNSVNQYSSGIASAVEEQSAATREISSNMHQAASGVENISININSITRGAGDADAGASEVLVAAKMLSEQSEKLDGEVKNFLAGIRA